MRCQQDIQPLLFDDGQGSSSYVEHLVTHGFRFFTGAFFFSPPTLDTSSSSLPITCILLFFFFVGVSPVPAAVPDAPAAALLRLAGPAKGELTCRASPRREDVCIGG